MPATVSKPRDVDSVLLRLPASVKQRAAAIAQSQNVSQNAFFATAVLTSAIMFGPVPELGSPENLRVLIEGIDEALKDDFPVIGAFHRNDWETSCPSSRCLKTWTSSPRFGPKPSPARRTRSPTPSV